MRTTLLTCLLLPCLCASGRGQAYGTDLLTLTGGGIFNPILLYALDGAGQWSIVESFPLAQRPGTLTWHVDNADLVLGNTNPFRVEVFDLAARQSVQTLYAGSPLRDVLAVRPLHTGDYVVADGLAASSVRIVRADGSGLATIVTLADRVNAVAQDLLTGEVLAGLSAAAGPSLVRIDPATGGVTPLDPTPRVVRSLVQDHRDGAIYYGADDDAIYRRDPNGGVSTFVPANHPSGARAFSLAFDRATGDGILVAGGSQRVVRFDFAPGGAPTVAAVHDGLPAAPVSARDLAFVGGRNVSSRRVGPANRWAFELSFPGEAGNGYALALSASGFAPGVPLDGRTIPLRPDALVAESLSGGLAPLLRDNVGTLDGLGRATATLDLSTLPPFGGFVLWAAAVTLDAAAPSGVRTVSKPIVVVLD